MSATPPVLAPDGSGTGAGAAADAAGAAAAEAALSPGFGSSAAIAGRTVPAASMSVATQSIHFVHLRRCIFMSNLLVGSGPTVPAERGCPVASGFPDHGKLMSTWSVAVFCPARSLLL